MWRKRARDRKQPWACGGGNVTAKTSDFSARKEQKTTKETRATASTGAKGATKGSAKATKEDTTKAKEKQTAKETNHRTRTTPATGQQGCRAPAWHIVEGEELQRGSAQHRGTTSRHKRHPGLALRRNWNDYDWNDESWDWNDRNYEDAANYTRGINRSHLTIGHIGPAKTPPDLQSLRGKRAKQPHRQHP